MSFRRFSLIAFSSSLASSSVSFDFDKIFSISSTALFFFNSCTSTNILINLRTRSSFTQSGTLIYMNFPTIIDLYRNLNTVSLLLSSNELMVVYYHPSFPGVENLLQWFSPFYSFNLILEVYNLSTSLSLLLFKMCIFTLRSSISVLTILL